MLNVLLTLLLVFGASQSAPRTVHQENPAKLIATEAGKESVAPSSRVYKAVLNNEGKESIRLSAVQMPGGYSGDGRFFACSLQLKDNKTGKWISHRLYDFSNPRHPPRIVQVQVGPGETLEVCNGLYPEQEGHAGDCARFALSPEMDQKPVFFSNTFTIVGGTKGGHPEECKP